MRGPRQSHYTGRKNTGRAASSRPTRILANLLVAAAVLVVVFPGTGAAADPDIGPFPGACPPNTPIPYPARYDYCLRVSEYATLSISPGSLSDGSEFTVTVEPKVATCAQRVVDRVYPCIEYINWSAGELCGIGSRLIANNKTFLTGNPDKPIYYLPFSIRPVSTCRLGTVDPATDLQRTFKLVHNPGIGPIPASWFVVGPLVRVRLSETTITPEQYPEAAARLSPTPTSNKAPTASFSWAPEPADPLTIEFDASASSDDEGVTRYEWSFDDGGTGSGQTIEHTFPMAGTYHVRLTVFDAEGLSGTETRDVVIEGHSIELSLDASTPQSQGVQRTQRIVYTIDAQPDERADELIVSATVPTAFVEIDESTIPGGGVVSADGKTVEWTLTNTTGTDPPLSFAVTVGADVPRSVLFISTEAHAHATFGDEEADASALRQTPLVQFGLVLTGDYVTERGDHVVPRDFATVRIQADAREKADEIVVDALVPKGSHLVPKSITGGGVQNGERAIRWTFENLRETAVLTFQIRVDALEDIPKEQKKLSAKTAARATFDGVPEAAENTLEIDLVRPTTIRGVTLDIVNSSPRLAVSTPAIGGIDVRLYELLSGRTVQTTVSAADGSFSVEAGEPMRYVLEAQKSVFVESLGSARTVHSRHIIEVRENGEVYVDDRLAETREDGSLVPLDAHVPVSLVTRTDSLLVGLGRSEIPYWLFAKFDARRWVLDPARSLGIPVPEVRFDTAKVAQTFDLILALRAPTQIRSDGYPTQFGGLYEPGNPATERDGWNALVRLNAMLVQLGGDPKNPARFGDAQTIIRPIALAIALQVTTTAMKAITDALNARIKARGGRGLARLPAQDRFFRILGMTDGIGVATPWLIEGLNGLGVNANKGNWIEVIAKAARYGMDVAFIALKKVGAWQTFFEDVGFEGIFNVVRLGVTGIMLQAWIDVLVQKDLDTVAGVGTTFAGSTSAVDNFIAGTDTRLSTGLLSAGNVQKLESIEALVVSAIRAYEGLMGVWGFAFKGKDPGRLPAMIQRLKGPWVIQLGPGASKVISPKDPGALQRLALAVNVLAVETGIVGLQALGLEVQKIAGALRNGADPQSVIGATDASSARRASAVERHVTAVRSGATTLQPSSLGVQSGARGLRSALAQYRLAAARTATVLKTQGRGTAPARALHSPPLGRVSERAAILLEPVLRRALAVQADAENATGAQRATSFVQAARNLATAHFDASARLDTLRQHPTSRREALAARQALTTLVERIRQIERSLSTVASRLERRLPGMLTAEAIDLQLPSEETMVSGRPFVARLTVWNAGDTATEPATAQLSVGPGLRVLGRASTSIRRVGPQGHVTLTWRLRATEPGAHLASPVQFTFRRGETVVLAIDTLIAALKS